MRLHPKTSKNVEGAGAKTFDAFCTIFYRVTVPTALGRSVGEVDTNQGVLPCNVQPFRSKELTSDDDIIRDYLRAWLFCGPNVVFPENGVVYLWSNPEGDISIGKYEIEDSLPSQSFQSKALITQRQLT